MMFLRTSGSPPVTRSLRTPSPMKAEHSRSSSSSVSSSAFGEKRHVLRHAVHASEIATIGDRNAKIGDRAVKRINKAVGVLPCTQIYPSPAFRASKEAGKSVIGRPSCVIVHMCPCP